MKYPGKKYWKNIISMKDFRFLLVDRIEYDLCNNILITGDIGSGKSTFFIKVASGFEDIEKLEKNCNDCLMKGQEPIKLTGYTSFDMDRDVVYTIKSLQNSCMDNRKAIIGADEAVITLAKRNAMTRNNKQLHQIITIGRKNHNNLFLLLPSIEDVDTSILQYCSHWIHIDSRGLAVVFMPNPTSIFGKKRWDIDACRKTYEKLMENNPKMARPPYWCYSNFRGYMKFGKLSKRREEMYLELADRKKHEEAKKNMEKKPKKNKLDDESEGKIKEITEKLMSGELSNSMEYYEYCTSLQFRKDKFNRLINDKLLLLGAGKTASKLLAENKGKKKSSNPNAYEMVTRVD